MIRLAPLLLLVAAASATAADTLLVGPPGSGAPYESIQAAVDAAQPGDAVCVLAGTYLEPEGVRIEKPLSLLGAGAASTVLEATPDLFVWEGVIPVVVHGLAAGEEVRVAGFTLVSTALGPVGGCTLAEVSACAGPVVLADLAGAGFGAVGPGAGAIHVSGSSQVLLDRCAIVGGQRGTIAQPALGVESSGVHVNACTLLGGSRKQTLDKGADGTFALIAVDSTVRLAATSASGGVAYGFTILGDPAPGDGGPALHALGSVIHVTGGAGNLLSGSAGVNEGVGAPAAVLDATSILRTAADVELAAGADGDGAVTAPVLELEGGLWSQLKERLAGLTLLPTVASPGGEIAVAPSGEPAAVCLTAFSLGQDPALAIPGVPGLALLDAEAFALLATSVLDAAGDASFAVAIPPVDDLAGLSVLLQDLCLSPSGLASFSAPALVAIVP